MIISSSYRNPKIKKHLACFVGLDPNLRLLQKRIGQLEQYDIGKNIWSFDYDPT
jgi:hypothetical protein